jgi:hypothetical protein
MGVRFGAMPVAEISNAIPLAYSRAASPRRGNGS